jgi:hypothetical protein
MAIHSLVEVGLALIDLTADRLCHRRDGSSTASRPRAAEGDRRGSGSWPAAAHVTEHEVGADEADDSASSSASWRILEW